MAGNFKKTFDEIQSLVDSSKSEYQKVNLLAVSKKQSIETIREFYKLGQKDFGENYLQEALEKIESLKNLNIRWHYIGQLQSKKIKDIIGKFELIQTVYRESEIQKISQLCEEKSMNQKILIQVNIAGEETKQGVLPEDLSSLIDCVKKHPKIILKGLMVFPPLEDSEEKARAWFKKSKELFDQFKTEEFSTLSMGTSQDFPWAISEGSTLVRIGERLMGSRTSQ